jgi:ribosomal protein S18 acetylase RimI-like enzyme
MLEGGFFEGWAAPPTVSQHRDLLAASTHCVLAIDDRQVVGFANALSDGILSAYIPLLEVLPRYRGAGIGTELARRLLHEIGPMYMVDVMCDADMLPFYERLGFRASTGGVIRNYTWSDSSA